MQNTDSYQNTYYHSARYVYFVIGTAFFTFGIMLLIRSTSIFLAVFMIIQALLFFWMAQTLKITVKPAEIYYSNLGLYTITSSWHNVKGIEYVNFKMVGPVKCIVLHQPSVIGWTGLAWMISREDRGRVIPLSGGWQNQPELEAIIKRHTILKQATQA